MIDGTRRHNEVDIWKDLDEAEQHEKYQTHHVEPAARRFRRGIEAAKPFVEQDLGFLLDLAFTQKTTDPIHTIRSTWPVSEQPAPRSITPGQKSILQGSLTLKQAAKV